MPGSKVKWSHEEVVKLIGIIKDLDCQSILDGKRQRNAEVFLKVPTAIQADQPQPANNTKDMEQCRSKFKKLKEKHKQERIAQSKSGRLFLKT